MQQTTDKGLDDLASLLDYVVKGMEQVPRWAKYVALGASPENDLQHTFSASLLAVIVIETLREKAPQWQFNAYAVLACVVLHDIGEIVEGDTHYIDKTSEKDNREFTAFSGMLGMFQSEVRKRLENTFSLQYAGARSGRPLCEGDDESKLDPMAAGESHREAIVFESIERLGYLLYAYHEYRDRADIPLMLQVCRHQHRELLKLTERIPAFGACFYPESLRTKIEALLAAYDGQHLE